MIPSDCREVQVRLLRVGADSEVEVSGHAVPAPAAAQVDEATHIRMEDDACCAEVNLLFLPSLKAIIMPTHPACFYRDH